MAKKKHFLVGGVIKGVRRLTAAEAEHHGLWRVEGYAFPKVLVVGGSGIDVLVLPKDEYEFLGHLVALDKSDDPVEGRELVSV